MAASRQRQKVRLWPAIVVVACCWVAVIITMVPSLTMQLRFMVMALGPLGGMVLYGGWLFFASGLGWREKWLIAVGAIIFAITAALMAHPTMGVAIWAYGVPLAMTAVTVVLAVGRSKPALWRLQWTWLVCGGVFALHLLLRLNGFHGNYRPQFVLRWSADVGAAHAGAAHAGTLINHDRPAVLRTEALQWPQFRGPDRNGRLQGPTQRPSWDEQPPTVQWRIPMGPAWSSFTMVGDWLFTQEQWDDREGVAAYDAATGQRIWQYDQAVLFDEVVSGAGPRATPTYADGCLYAMGAKGHVIALDASDGSLLWRRDLMAAFDAALPMWGFASSPLVVGDQVIVHAGGPEDKGLLALAANDGALTWSQATRGMNFASAQALAVAGQMLVVFTDADGVMAVDPASGERLWQFKPSAYEGLPIVQCQQLPGGDLVVPLGDGMGLARLKITQTEDQWQVRELWSSRGLKPAFNDFLFHKGFLYGFDRNIFACIDAETGERRWKGGRYGFGQALLLAASDSILILAEKGDVIVLAADPREHRELARFAALKGKTWNHPVATERRLFVRNGREAVAFVW